MKIIIKPNRLSRKNRNKWQFLKVESAMSREQGRARDEEEFFRDTQTSADIECITQ
jgi:hypothetical protein